MTRIAFGLVVSLALLLHGCEHDDSVHKDEEKTIGGVRFFNADLMAKAGSESNTGSLIGRFDWIIKLVESVGEDVVDAICDNLPTDAKCFFQENRTSTSGFLFASLSKTELEDVLLAHPGKVEYIEPDARVASVPEISTSTSSAWFPWGLDRIDDRSGLDGSYGGSSIHGHGVDVYVFDTGVNTQHVDFEGRAIPTLDMTRAVECRGATNCAVDDNGHGTHCAGIIAGKTYGVARGAKIHAVKVCAGSSCGPLSWSITALHWMVQFGEAHMVASMSLGGPGNSVALTNAVDMATTKGITVVVAAGNLGDDACGYSPAGIGKAITVGGTNNKDEFFSHSNWGSCVDILAPAVDIISASHSSTTGSATKTGTSMACPHVSGAAALLKTRYSDPLSRLLSQATQNKIINFRGNSSTVNKLLYVGDDLA